MSGVLDRMIKRTHGALPLVQPLVTPHVAEFGGLNEMVEEREPRLIRRPATPKPMLEKNRATGLSEPANLDHSDKTNGRSQKAEVFDYSHILSELQLNAKSVLASQDDVLQHPGKRDRQSMLEPESASAHERPTVIATKQGSSAAAKRGEEIGIPASVGRENEIEIKNTSRSVDDRLTHSQAAPAEERTEIHISIGSIELRAPRSEAKARPVAFKPRVTLDEFLRRNRGGGA